MDMFGNAMTFWLTCDIFFSLLTKKLTLNIKWFSYLLVSFFWKEFKIKELKFKFRKFKKYVRKKKRLFHIYNFFKFKLLAISSTEFYKVIANSCNLNVSLIMQVISEIDWSFKLVKVILEKTQSIEPNNQ